MRLAGKRVVNTRAAHQAAALDDMLRAEGAIPLSYPATAIIPPKDRHQLDEALVEAAKGKYDLLALTSANTVESIAERANRLDVSLKGLSTAAVGTTTAEAAREKLGVEIMLIPDEQTAEALAYALAIEAGVRILLPQAENARPTLAQMLTARGAQVQTVIAYRTVRGSGGVKIVPMLREGAVDALTFTSAAGVGYFGERVRDEGGADFTGVCAACLSERISRTAREQGFRIVAEARTRMLVALVAALVEHYEAEKR